MAFELISKSIIMYLMQLFTTTASNFSPYKAAIESRSETIISFILFSRGLFCPFKFKAIKEKNIKFLKNKREDIISITDNQPLYDL